MRTYTWKCGEVSEGLALRNDERLGMVVFLGEEGRGRRYEKVALGRRNSAEVIKGKVMEARPVKITLPAKEGKPEKVFYVLENPLGEEGPVLVRVCTEWVYTKGTRGSWSTLSGTPEVLVSGYGAHGIAGRIGNWDDGLIVMKPGDALKVKAEGGRKTDAYALWVAEDGKPQTATFDDWERLTAMAKVEAVIDEVQAVSEVLPVVFDQAKCFTLTWGGEFRPGIEVGTSLAGPAVVLGETGRGREQVSIPLVGFAADKVAEAAVVRLDKNVLGFTQTSASAEPQGALVRFYYPHRHRALTAVKKFRGNPTLLAAGNFATGDAGYAGHTPDELWALRPGDICAVGHGEPSRILENVAGEIRTTEFREWELGDADADPEAYAAKGKARPNRIPAGWLGRVVTVVQRRRDYDYNEKKYVGTRFEEVLTGELVSASPLRINTGWEGGRDRKIEKPYDKGNGDYLEVVWVNLDADKVVQKPSGDEVGERDQAKASAEQKRQQLETVAGSGYFRHLPEELRQRFDAIKKRVSSWWQFYPAVDEWATEDIKQFMSSAEALLTEIEDVSAPAKALQARVDSGEILVDFAWKTQFRKSVEQGAAWVIAADGSLLPPTDVVERVKFRGGNWGEEAVPFDKALPYYEGNHRWPHIIGGEYLVLTFQGSSLGGAEERRIGEANFTVAKLPVGGVTEVQLKTLNWVEHQIAIEGGRIDSGSPQAAERWQLVHGKFLRQLKK